MLRYIHGITTGRILFLNIRFFLCLMCSLILPVEQMTWASEKTVIYPSHKTRHHIYKRSRQTGLPVLANQETALPSNANNFHGAWNASVDARTGTVSFSFNVAKILFDLGLGRRELTLSYKGSASAGGPDTFGLGPHWYWNIGTEHPSTSEVAGHMSTDITTGNGYQFTMISDRDPHGITVWHPLRHKLQDVTITGKPGNWTITQPGGFKEHLLHGYEDWEETSDGKRIWFYYDHTGANDLTRHLACICTHPPEIHMANGTICHENRLELNYHERTVIIHGQQKIVLNLSENSGIGRIQSISIPSLSSHELIKSSDPDRIYFSYDDKSNRPWLLQTITYPTGYSSIFLYNEESDRSDMKTPGLHTGFNNARIPVVTEQITHYNCPGLADRHIWYSYENPHINEHNYTGYQGNNTLIPGQDNLLDRDDDYTYSVTQDNGLTRNITTYNKYHLPLRVVQIENQTQRIIGENRIEYPPWKKTVFSQLPPNYSLPVRTEKIFYDHDESKAQTRIMTSQQYDRHGRLIWKKDAYGRQTFIQYCPLRGDAHCPHANLDWPYTRYPEKILLLPARHSPEGSKPFLTMADNEGTNNAIEQVYDYSKQVNPWNMHEKNAKIPSYSRGIWHMIRKTVTTIPIVIMNQLKPGQSLPEPSSGNLSTRTLFMYEKDRKSPFYGLLHQIKVIRHSPSPFIKLSGHTLKMDTDYPFVQADIESILLSIKRHADFISGTFSTDFSVSTTPLNKKNNPSHLLQMTRGKALYGTRVFSMEKGVQISYEDPGNLFHTSWTYDQWNRPVSMTVTPSSGGKNHTTHWMYRVNGHTNTIVTRYPDSSEKKTVLSGSGELLSAWHRFKPGKLAHNTWIPDLSITYTAFGKAATKTVWHAGDPDRRSAGRAIALVTRYGYDSLNRPVWTKYPDNRTRIIVYDDTKMRAISYEMATDPRKRLPQHSEIMSVAETNISGKPVATYLLSLEPFHKKNGHDLYNPPLRTQLQSLLDSMQPEATLKTIHPRNFRLLSEKSSLLAFTRSAIASEAWISHMVMQYDGFLEKISMIQPGHRVTRYLWKDNSLKGTILPDGRLIHDTRNIQGHTVSRCVQPANENFCHVLGNRGYDAAGNLSWQTSETGLITRYRHDMNNRLVSVTRPAALSNSGDHVFTFHYNSLGMTEADLDGIAYVTYHYDPVSWHITDREDSISHLHYDYNQTYGNVIKIAYSPPVFLHSESGLHYPAFTLFFKWNRYGKIISTTDPAGNIHTKNHDRLGRVIRKQVLRPGRERPSLLASIEYDAFSRPSVARNGIGVTRVFAYNDTGRLESTTDTLNHQRRQTISYTYDDETGNILSMTRQNSLNIATERFRYDLQNNLVEMHCSMNRHLPSSSSMCPHDTSLQGSELDTPPAITSQYYTFDQWNNIQSVTEHLITNDEKNIIKTTHYTYMSQLSIPAHAQHKGYDPHRLTAFSVQWSNEKFSTPPHTITYDEKGQMTKDADGNSLHYNAFGQQDRFTSRKNGNITHYAYNSFGHQVAEQTFNAKGKPLQSPLYMIHSGNTIIARTQKDNNGYVHTSMELEGLAHSEDGTITKWYLHNYRGDVTETIDSEGTTIKRSVYSPYGMQYHPHSAKQASGFHKLSWKMTTDNRWWKTSPGFAGQPTDPATGYQFLGGGYRAYNPEYRHFLSKDSYSPFIEMDGYGFGNNNPVMNSDPTGHLPTVVDITLGIAGIVLTISMMIVIPVSAAGVAVQAGTSAFSSALEMGLTSAALGSMGILSGSLQLASVSHPHNRKLALSSDIFGILASFTSMAQGLMAGAFFVRHLTEVINGYLLVSSIATSTHLITDSAYFSIKTAMLGNRELSAKSGYENALKLIALLSFLASATGAFFTIPAIQHEINFMLEAQNRTGYQSINTDYEYFPPSGRSRMLPPSEAEQIRRNESALMYSCSPNVDPDEDPPVFFRVNYNRTSTPRNRTPSPEPDSLSPLDQAPGSNSTDLYDSVFSDSEEHKTTGISYEPAPEPIFRVQQDRSDSPPNQRVKNPLILPDSSDSSFAGSSPEEPARPDYIEFFPYNII